MASLKFLLDSMCANFTEHCLYDLVRVMVDERPCTVSEIAVRVAARDRSLDTESAETLADGAIEALAQIGQVAVREGWVFPID